MVQHKNEVPGGVYFFVSLEAKGKAPVFRDAFFKTKVERRWTALTATYPYTTANEFVVNDNAVHAMVILTADVQDPQAQLEEMLKSFQQVVLEDWKQGAELWNPLPKIRRITKKDELSSLRDFIVQKMLGGKELSRLEELDDEEDEGYGPYEN
jgi:hypothetical protein